MSDVNMLKEKEKIFRLKAKEELDEYKTARDRFYSNPIHWSNNKRKMNGMTVLRGECNKTRIKNFPTYRISPALFDAMEECIDAAICENMFETNQFVSDKELNKWLIIKKLLESRNSRTWKCNCNN